MMELERSHAAGPEDRHAALRASGCVAVLRACGSTSSVSQGTKVCSEAEKRAWAPADTISWAAGGRLCKKPPRQQSFVKNWRGHSQECWEPTAIKQEVRREDSDTSRVRKKD